MKVRLPIKIQAKARVYLNKLLGKEELVVVGSYRAYKYQLASPALKINCEGNSWSKNMLMLVGKDAIMRRLGNMSGGGYVAKIGTGDSASAVANTQTDLQAATNKAWKAFTPATDVNYIRPTLFCQVNFGFNENNWTWNELGLRDNNDVMWARQVDASPIVKNNSFAATVEWQLELA